MGFLGRLERGAGNEWPLLFVAEKPKTEPEQRTQQAGLRAIAYFAFCAAAGSVALCLAHVITWEAGAALTLLFLSAGCYALFRAHKGMDESKKGEKAAAPQPEPVTIEELCRRVQKLDPVALIDFFRRTDLDAAQKPSSSKESAQHAALQKLKRSVQGEVADGRERVVQVALKYFDDYAQKRSNYMRSYEDFQYKEQRIQALHRYEARVLAAPKMEQLEKSIRLRFGALREMEAAFADHESFKHGEPQYINLDYIRMIWGRVVLEARKKLVQRFAEQFERLEIDTVILNRLERPFKEFNNELKAAEA